jgi:hypothetical protein
MSLTHFHLESFNICEILPLGVVLKNMTDSRNVWGKNAAVVKISDSIWC